MADSNDAFHIARDVLKPPASLLHEIFPEVDDWEAKHTDRSNPAGVKQTVTARHTLLSIQYLRSVFIQDSVFLRERWPHLAVWSHDFFKLPAFESFACDLKAACALPDVINPSTARIEADTRTYIDSRFDEVKDYFTEMKHFMSNDLASRSDSKAALESQHRLARMMSSGLTWRVPLENAPGPSNTGASSSSVLGSVVQRSPHVDTERSNPPVDANASALGAGGYLPHFLLRG